MHTNNQAKWVILEQHLGERLRKRKKKSQQPVSNPRFEFRPLKREEEYQPTPHILGKYICRRSRLSDSGLPPYWISEYDEIRFASVLETSLGEHSGKKS